jgi:oligopeptide transport system substrate-binding protein
MSSLISNSTFIRFQMKQFLVVLVFASLWASCKSKPAAEQQTFMVLKGGVKSGGTFRTNNASDISSLDPARLAKQSERIIGLQIFDSIVGLNDSTLALEPLLAKSWDISPDGLVYTFYLRNDVYFHDNPCFPDGKGKKFSAADLKYSLTRSVDARVQALGTDFFTTCVEGASEYYAATIEASKTKAEPSIKEVSGYIVKDDTTFVVKLKEPYAPFLYHLTTSFAFITCKEAADKYGSELARHPVGTGGFVFVSWDEDREVILKRNPKYWLKDSFGNQLPYLDGISYRFLKDPTAQFLEFQKGGFDESIGIPQEFAGRLFDDHRQLKDEYKTFVLKSVPELRIDYIAFQTQSPLFKNAKLRQAISSAIDREKMVRFVLKNQVAPATGIVATGIAGYDNTDLKPLSFNPEKAKSLLAEAGYPNGKGLPDITLNTFLGAKYAYNKEVAEAVQSMLKDIGVNINIEQTDYSAHLNNAYPGKLGFFIASWGADYPEPESFLNLVYGNVVPKEPHAESYLNMSRYVNPEFDKVFAEALKTSDQKKRYEFYKQAEQIALNDAPLIVTYYRLFNRFQQPYVRNYPINAMDERGFRWVWLDK